MPLGKRHGASLGVYTERAGSTRMKPSWRSRPACAPGPRAPPHVRVAGAAKPPAALHEW